MLRFKNKYKLLLGLALLLLFIDVVVHKGQARVLLGKQFTPTLFVNTTPALPINIAQKEFVKGVNNIERFNNFAKNAKSIEVDFWFDSATSTLKVCHDLAKWRGEEAVGFIAAVMQATNHKNELVIYCDIKNLDTTCHLKVLQILNNLRATHQLSNRLIVESRLPAALDVFYEAKYYTVYYTPSFNPYTNNTAATEKYLNAIKNNLVQHKICALSGYYFQAPILQQAFSNIDIFQWQAFSKYSLVGQLYKRSVYKNSNILGLINN
jgi:hypothetical protein